MNFREFVNLQEIKVGQYAAIQDKTGKIHVVPDNQYVNYLVKKVSPQKVWKFSIEPRTSQVNIPGATPEEKNDILLAYYGNWGLDKQELDPHSHSDSWADVMDPTVTHPDYLDQRAEHEKKKAYLASTKQAPFSISGGTKIIRPTEPDTTDY